MRFLAIVFALGLFPAAGAAQQATNSGRPELSLPLACEPHKTCFIQNYVDDDFGPGVRDYACGAAAYDGHKGTDFRLLSVEVTKSNVPVLASADGSIKAVRDGIADVFARDGKPEDIKGRECGNGVVIDHGGGWETQYCHVKSGSLVVAKGQAVKRGDKLGAVGYSGQADFAHVHLSVRHDGKEVDPFAPDQQEGVCQKDGRLAGMWRPEIVAAFPYRNGEILTSGFAVHPPKLHDLEKDHSNIALPGPEAPALLFYGRQINLSAGDRIRMLVAGPGGSLVEQLSEPLDRHKAVYLSFVGVKRKQPRWPPGRYEGRIEIVREGAVVATSTATHEMPDELKR
jgi:murein DD-endopeptidase MepM/ murein hydrolase activator NlpD